MEPNELRRALPRSWEFWEWLNGQDDGSTELYDPIEEYMEDVRGIKVNATLTRIQHKGCSVPMPQWMKMFQWGRRAFFAFDAKPAAKFLELLQQCHRQSVEEY